MVASRRLGSRIVAAAIAASLATTPFHARAEPARILTGGIAGVYYPLGAALAKIYRDRIPAMQAEAQATKASIENLSLLQKGAGELAFTLGDSLAQAWSGNLDAGFRLKLDGLRTVAAIYPNYVQIVASKSSGIRTLADLKGRRVSVGAPRSGTELNARKILTAAGLRYEDLGRVEYQPFSESVQLIRANQLDATLQSAGLGVSSIRELALAIDIVVVEIPPSVIERLGPPYEKGTIPAGTYAGQSTDVSTVRIQNFLVTRASLSDDLVYRMTRAMFENLDELGRAHSAAGAIRLADAPKGSPVPLHPGAARFYKEKGLVF